MLLHSTAADRTGRRKLKTRARPFAEDNSAAGLNETEAIQEILCAVAR
jgi:hypothetical protein